MSRLNWISKAAALGALLVAAACTSSTVTIGEDDAGSDAAALDGGAPDSGRVDSGVDSGPGEPCGDNVCGDGEYCCNASCGWCAAEGVACPAIACEPEPVFCNGERCEGEGAICCPGCNPGESFCSDPSGACPDLACPPPPVECPDGTACGIGEQCCPGPVCGGPYECRPEGDPCPAAPACPPNVCDDGTVCGDEERCCPGCGGEFLCVGAATCPVVDCPPPPPGCEPDDARGVGACEAIVGVAWDGSRCVTLSGCSCEGTDCGRYATLEECAAAHADCTTPPECAPQRARGVGACDLVLGYVWNGSTCEALSGCSCEGTDCGRYATLEECTVAHAECLAAPGCDAQSARGVGACDLVLGVVWSGTACEHLSGCSCEGADCGRLYPTVDACMTDRWSCLRPPACSSDTDCGRGHYCDPCATSSCPGCDDCVAGCMPHRCRDQAPLTCRAVQPECGPSGVAIVGPDGCWICVDAGTCEPLPPG